MFKNFIYYSAGPGGTRNNSSIVWKKLIGDHWFVGANYAFGAKGQGASDNGGGGTPGQFTNGSGEAFSVAYNKLDVGPGYFDLNATYTRANISNLINQAELFGGNYVFGIYRLNAGYVHYTGEQGISKGVKNAAGTRTDNSWTASGSVLITPKVEVALGYTRMQGNHACVSGTVKNPMYGDASACTLSNIVSSGGVGTIFDSIIYHADKQIDIYLASDYTMVSGGWVVSDAQKNGTKLGKGQLYNSELEIATGVRFKF